MAKIKICGIMRKQDIDAVNAALPDYIGFVFAKSRRQIDESRAKELKARLNPSIKAVGVFVNQDIDYIVKLCSSNVIDIIQLHGDEDEGYIQNLRSHVPNEIIKAFRVKHRDDVKKSMGYSCDYLLFDTYHEGNYGGTGRAFDWSLISGVSKPCFLAGGINVSNIAQAIRQCNPYCIDISSGAEQNGYKDPDKIMKLIEIARNI
jgi:phosphoribosylanthranilate isomerase